MSDDLLRRALFNADGTGTIANNDQAARDAIGEDEAKAILMAGSDGVNAFPIAVDENGVVQTSAVIEGDVNVDNNSVGGGFYVGKTGGTNADFAVTYASAVTLSLGTFPAGITNINHEDIVAIQQIALAGSVTQTYTRDDVTITDDAGGDPTVITVVGAVFLNTDLIVIYTSITRLDEAAIRTAAELIDDAIGTDDAAAPTKSMQGGGKYESSPTEVDDGDGKAKAITSFGYAKAGGFDDATDTQKVSDPEPLASKSGSVVLLDVTLDADPTSDTSTPFFIGNKNKFTVFLRSDIDWTDSNPDILVTYTFRAGPSAADLYDISVISNAGADAPVASIIHTTGGDSDLETEESIHLPDGLCAEYFEITATATGSDADDTAIVDAIACWKKG